MIRWCFRKFLCCSSRFGFLFLVVVLAASSLIFFIHLKYSGIAVAEFALVQEIDIVKRLALKIRESQKESQEEFINIYKHILNMTDLKKPELQNQNQQVTQLNGMGIPNLYHFAPHLSRDERSLRPAFIKSRRHADNNAKIVLGIPTVKRQFQSYLLSTLQNLITSMSEKEQAESLIVIFVGETNLTYVESVWEQLLHHYQPYIDSGLIELISPPASYYPDMEKLKGTLGDTFVRVKWRTKQNFDFAFLMMYCQEKGQYYVQLEDDIVATPGFITTMTQFVLVNATAHEDWFVLDFCLLGFIGKMFKTSQLPWLIQYIFMFHNEKPIDWLLEHLIQTRICRLDTNISECEEAKNQIVLHHKPSLFQHVGSHSSLHDKNQALKDNEFGMVPLYTPHINPPAFVNTSLKHYQNFTLTGAYLGDTYFWGVAPTHDSYVSFFFTPPIFIQRYHFRSGNLEHPSDRFYETAVELCPVDGVDKFLETHITTVDGYVVAGPDFDDMGIANGNVDPALGRIQSLRLHVLESTEQWVILSEIYIEEAIR